LTIKMAHSLSHMLHRLYQTYAASTNARCSQATPLLLRLDPAAIRHPCTLPQLCRRKQRVRPQNYSTRMVRTRGELGSLGRNDEAKVWLCCCTVIRGATNSADHPNMRELPCHARHDDEAGRGSLFRGVEPKTWGLPGFSRCSTEPASGSESRFPSSMQFSAPTGSDVRYCLVQFFQGGGSYSLLSTRVTVPCIMSQSSLVRHHQSVHRRTDSAPKSTINVYAATVFQHWPTCFMNRSKQLSHGLLSLLRTFVF
jgi:hypothetical protein